MVELPHAPGRAAPRLRGDYARAAADYTVQQQWRDYGADAHDIWRLLYARQMQSTARFGVPETLAGLRQLGAEPDHIPDFAIVNQRLEAATGWRIVAVPGLIPDEHFFAHLASKQFPVSVWIRERSELDYLSEPDLFHDFFGHVPLLADPVFARFMQAYGRAGEKALAHGAVPMLARLYWYTVEFGLIDTAAGLRAYGAGILSSLGETHYSIESPVPHRLRFDLERILRTKYLIDEFQCTYFVIDSFEQLFQACYQIDFAPLYRKLGGLPAIDPGVVLPEDRVVDAASGSPACG